MHVPQIKDSRSGRHLPQACTSGVAVASQVLCTSTTLNKRKVLNIQIMCMIEHASNSVKFKFKNFNALKTVKTDI